MRAAIALEDSRICGGRGADARPRHRRQHRHLHRRQCRVAEAAAFPGYARLVRMTEFVPATETPDGRPRRSGSISVAELLELRSRAKTLSSVSFTAGPAIVTMSGRGEEPPHLKGMRVAPGIFETLGVPPLLGRGFGAAEEASGNDAVIVFSYQAWRRHFGGDPRILGETVTLANSLTPNPQGVAKKYVVVGVMPRDPSSMTGKSNSGFRRAGRVRREPPAARCSRVSRTASRFKPLRKPLAACCVRCGRQKAWSHVQARPPHRTALSTRETRAPDAHRCCRLRAAHRVRERRQPAAGANGRPASRDGDSCRTRRRSRAPDAASSDGKRDPGARRS